MLTYKSLVLSGLAFTLIYAAQADPIQSINNSHQQCKENCESTRDAAMSMLPCDYYEVKAAFDNCRANAESTRDACIRGCNGTEGEAKQLCRQQRRDDRGECRETKRDETQACREAKRSEKDACKAEKIDDKEACKQLSGQEKRRCKKQAREDKRECKRIARETKKLCKQEAREDKNECKDEANEERNACISQANDAGQSCRSRCRDVFEQSCIEESQDYNECAPLANPILDEANRCMQICDDTRAERLEGHDANCPSEHAGDKGVSITFVNGTNQTRYYDRPTSQTRGALAPGESYTVELACGTQWSADFYEGSDGAWYIQRHPIPPYPCCDQAAELTLPISR